MSKEMFSVKMMNKYATWYHNQKLAKLAGERTEEPTIHEFISTEFNNSNIGELVEASVNINKAAKLLGL